MDWYGNEDDEEALRRGFQSKGGAGSDPACHGADALAARIALGDNRSLDLRGLVTALARAREHLEPLRAFTHRIITRGYRSGSQLQPDQGAETRRCASSSQGGVAAPLMLVRN